MTTLTIEFDDIAADTHGAVVSWGDGATTTVLAATSPISLTHTYLDDNPTATPVDIVTDGIRVTVTDDDLGETTATADLRISNVVPAIGFPDATVAADGVAELSVQYSDPLGGNPSTGSIGDFLIVADDVAADSLALRVRFDGAVGPSTWLQTSSPTCVTAGSVHQTCTWSVSAVPDPVSGIHTDIAPGTYDLVLNVVDDDTGTAGVTLRITVLPEDARIWYSGPTMAATESAASGEAELELRATVRDITGAVPPTDPQWDPWPGDIRTATMRFVDRDDSSGSSLCQTETVDEVFSPFDPFDPSTSIGVGTCDWEAVINGDASEYIVASVIGGNYTRDRTEDDNVVVVARPLDDFITGGGFLVLTDSDGAYAGDDDTHANFGFHVKFNKRGTNLQGGATIIVRADDRVYKIKSNSTTSLGVDGNAAQFEAKANLVDVTDEANTVSIAGNLVLQMRMVDLDEAEGEDQVGFALWDIQRTGNGKNATTTQLLLFSSNWSGEETELQRIDGGNLMVH